MKARPGVNVIHAYNTVLHSAKKPSLMSSTLLTKKKNWENNEILTDVAEYNPSVV